MSFGFRGQRVDEHAAEKSAHRGDHHEQPKVQRMVHGGQPGHRRLATRSRRGIVAGENPQGTVFHGPRGDIKGDAAQARHHARQGQEPNLAADAIASQAENAGEPAIEPALSKTSRKKPHAAITIAP